jgi:SAM-dependent methyltransferase
VTDPQRAQPVPLPPAGGPGASAWERIHSRIISYQEETARIIPAAQAGRGWAILDLACGTGRHLIEAARLGHRCTGIDQQLWKIERARMDAKALGLDIEFRCGDIRHLDIAPHYDLVVCLYALSVMKTDEEVENVFATARKALKPGGRLIFNVLNRDAPDPSPAPPGSDPGHLRNFGADEILHLLDKAGFDAPTLEYFDVAGIEKLDLFVSARAGE